MLSFFIYKWLFCDVSYLRLREFSSCINCSFHELFSVLTLFVVIQHMQYTTGSQPQDSPKGEFRVSGGMGLEMGRLKLLEYGSFITYTWSNSSHWRARPKCMFWVRESWKWGMAFEHDRKESNEATDMQCVLVEMMPKFKSIWMQHNLTETCVILIALITRFMW